MESLDMRWDAPVRFRARPIEGLGRLCKALSKRLEAAGRSGAARWALRAALGRSCNALESLCTFSGGPSKFWGAFTLGKRLLQNLGRFRWPPGTPWEGSGTLLDFVVRLRVARGSPWTPLQGPEALGRCWKVLRGPAWNAIGSPWSPPEVLERVCNALRCAWKPFYGLGSPLKGLGKVSMANDVFVSTILWQCYEGSGREALR